MPPHMKEPHTQKNSGARRTPRRALVFIAAPALAAGALTSVQSASAAPSDAAARPAPAAAIGLSTGWKLQLPELSTMPCGRGE
ncbi:hypothetical protein SSPO_095040 [Streptomyces antimycoticus]|uniref:Uncharacterized protein n=1 Tax=Streptomyces antimycoticus TaxID=68175 RepID=A0A499VF13_9ACTN|nr:hypothetical protein SSPO_095040 [Streptomyces antimycoticus]